MIRLVLHLLILSGLLFGAGGCSQKQEETPQSAPERVISLAPSITETLFALGVGDKVVGVTRYCNFPAATDSITKVGGFRGINLEQVAVLQPDMIFLQPEHEKIRLYCENNGIPYHVIRTHSLKDITDNFQTISRAMHIPQTGDSLAQAFHSNFESARRSNHQRDNSQADQNQQILQRPKILFVVGRSNPGSNAISQVYSIAKGTLFDEVIEAAGGRNALETESPEFPLLSQEGLIALAPDIILDVVSTMTKDQCEENLNDWYSLRDVPAVKNKSIFCINEEYATIPGPRIQLLLKDLQNIILQGKNNVANNTTITP